MLLCNIINMYTERGGTQTHRGCRDTHRERGAQTHRESEGGGVQTRRESTDTRREIN